MKKFNLFFGLCAIAVVTFGVLSCSKDTPNEKINIALETRTAFDKPALEQFRLNILNPSSNATYSISDIEKSIEGLYNLLAAKEVSTIENQRIYTDSVNFTASSGMLSNSQASQLSEFVFQGIKNFAFGNNTKFAMLDISTSVNGNDVKFYRSVYTGDLSPPELINSSGLDCTIKSFKSSDCFLSSYGDLDLGGTINAGGPCNNPNNSTSAQEQVQRKIQRDIPKYVYDKKGNITGVIKYINSDCDNSVELWKGDLSEYLEEFSNCNGLALDFRDDLSSTSELQYTGDELNCTICALKKRFNALCPPGKVVCNVNVWGDGLISNYIFWRAEVCFCDAIVTPIIIRETVQNLTSTTDNTTLLNTNSILNF